MGDVCGSWASRIYRVPPGIVLGLSYLGGEVTVRGGYGWSRGRNQQALHDFYSSYDRNRSGTGKRNGKDKEMSRFEGGRGAKCSKCDTCCLEGGLWLRNGPCMCEQEYWATSRAVSLVWWGQQPGCRGSRERIDVRKWPLWIPIALSKVWWWKERESWEGYHSRGLSK